MKEFFKEQSEWSLMRLMSFICLMVAVLLAVVSLFMEIDRYLIGMFLVSAFGGKVGQKAFERK